jgi:stringent starvation protein B
MTHNNDGITSHKPYLVNAYKDWMDFNNLGAIALFYVRDTVAKVPKAIICEKNGTVNLDISKSKVNNFVFDGSAISFNTELDGSMEHISIPLDLVLKLSPSNLDNKSATLPFELNESMIKKYIKERNGLKLVK